MSSYNSLTSNENTQLLGDAASQVDADAILRAAGFDRLTQETDFKTIFEMLRFAADLAHAADEHIKDSLIPELQARILEIIQRKQITVPGIRGALRRIFKKRADQPKARGGSYYEIRDGGIVAVHRTRVGDVVQPLCNFECRIARELVYDDGCSQTRYFSVTTSLGDVEISAAEFGKMEWPLERLGARAIVEPGAGIKDSLRAAILSISASSGPIPCERVITSTGWHKTSSGWAYVSASGAITANGTADFSISLDGALKNYNLPTNPSEEEIRAGLGLTFEIYKNLAPPRVTVPLIAAAFLAPLVSLLDHALVVWIYGPTGSRKTTLAALIQAHFGSGFSYSNLPAGWSSTANYLGKLSFLCKDALLTVDDFCPGSNTMEAAADAQKAAAVIRAVTNRTGRGRLTASAQLRDSYPARCSVLSTGESLPSGQSTVARLIPVELRPDDVDLAVLSDIQRKAGTLCFGMAGHIRDIAGHLDKIDWVKEKAREYRQDFVVNSTHGRSPDLMAHALIGWETFLTTAVEHEVIDERTFIDAFNDGRRQLLDIAGAASLLVGIEDPASIFCRVILQEIERGKLCLDALNCPDSRPTSGAERIGWEEDGTWFLLGEAAFRAVFRFCQECGKPVTVGWRAMLAALKRHRIVVAQTRITRPSGNRPRVLVVKREALQQLASGENLPQDSDGLPSIEEAVQAAESDENWD
jgi:hypothetical protein